MSLQADEASFLAAARARGLSPAGRSFADRTLRELAGFWDRAVFGARASGKHAIEPRLKVLLAAGLLVLTSFLTQPRQLAGIAIAVGCLIAASVRRRSFSWRDFLGAGFGVAVVFSALGALPAVLNLFAHREAPVLVALADLGVSRSFGPWVVPAVIGITEEGLASALTLVLRTSASIGAVLWLVLSLRWLELLKALRALGVPALALQLLAMTLIFLHLLVRRTEEVHLAKRARTIGRESARRGGRWTASRLAQAWLESERLVEEVHQAMISRGFRGEARLGGR